MRLLGIETENPRGDRELYTFECERCQKLEVRGVRVTSWREPSKPK
jgi:hypothetical protein